MSNEIRASQPNNILPPWESVKFLDNDITYIGGHSTFIKLIRLNVEIPFNVTVKDVKGACPGLVWWFFSGLGKPVYHYYNVDIIVPPKPREILTIKKIFGQEGLILTGNEGAHVHFTALWRTQLSASEHESFAKTAGYKTYLDLIADTQKENPEGPIPFTFIDNSLSFPHSPRPQLRYILSGLGVGIKGGETLHNLKGTCSKIVLTQPPSQVIVQLYISPKDFVNPRPEEALTLTVFGHNGLSGVITGKEGAHVEFGPPLVGEHATEEDEPGKKHPSLLRGSVFKENTLHVRYSGGRVDIPELKIPFFSSDDVSFYNISGTIFKLVTFDHGDNSVWLAEGYVIWDEGATIEIIGPLTTTTDSVITFATHKDGQIKQKQIFKRVHLPSHEKATLAQLAGYKSWEAYVASRKQ
ncbi:uncharacterized protein EI90DRAFT_3031654 [Cantharellus anzutake]|uniref:uncharacterized protein n=1 Tax=Cantharellus anzutake TaxID=1750568 RepID=UPI00190408CE|nr:uncharacterized protein EI90DRAFT_3031654 [Cantharellus anzutake]KAF8343186.1 hypothetical protein EI90DRAFT_3031654 [Cantharellus anzutake]